MYVHKLVRNQLLGEIVTNGSLCFILVAISKIGRVRFSLLAFKSKWIIRHLQKIGQILRRRVFDSHTFSSSCVFVFSTPILFPLPAFPLHLDVEDEDALVKVGNIGTAGC